MMFYSYDATMYGSSAVGAGDAAASSSKIFWATVIRFGQN